MILEIKNLNKSFGNNHVLKDVCFSVTAERTLGLLGRNGHGKTTTMKIIMGIINSDSGEITVDGIFLNQDNFKLGYLPEERGLYQKVSIIDQMVYFAKLRGLDTSFARESALYLLERLDMTEYIDKQAITLSKGNQQKIQLAIALLNDPDIIILDEPYSGLDPVNSQLLRELIEENAKMNKIIIFSSHQLDTVEEFCQDICIMNYGQVLLNGNLSDIKNAYPKDRLLVVSESGKKKDLEWAIETNPYVLDAIDRYEPDGDSGFILYLKDVSTKNKTISYLLSKDSLCVDSLSLVEPTLLEIFLEKVGEKHG